MKYQLILITLLLVCTSFTVFDSTNGTLWREDSKLIWDDFKANPQNNYSEAAMTASSIEFGYKGTNTTYTFTVHAKFFPYESWSLKEKQDDYILAHEQLHFDITELYARKLRKAIQEQLKTRKDTYKLKQLVQYYMNEWNKMQQLYDKESKHSINKEKQLYWNAYVEAELAKLTSYSITIFTLNLK